MKKVLVILMSIMMIFSLVACGSGSETSEASGDEMAKIGVTIYKFDDNFMSFVRRSIATASEGQAELILNDSNNSQATQNDQVDMMISKGVKSLAINLVDPQAAPSIISKAKDKNLPVVFFNKEPEASVLKSYEKAWYVGTASAEAGIIQGEMIAKMWAEHPEWDRNGDGVLNYVLLKGEPGHPDAEARTKYSVEVVKEAGIEMNELELQTGMWDSVKGKELMDAWLSKHGEEIEFVICNNDGMALGAIESLKGNGYFGEGTYMPVVGVDAIPDALEQIKNNYMAGTVLNDAANQGKATFELAYNVAMGKDPVEGTDWELDGNKAVRVPYVSVTLENIEFAEEAYK